MNETMLGDEEKLEKGDVALGNKRKDDGDDFEQFGKDVKVGESSFDFGE